MRDTEVCFPRSVTRARPGMQKHHLRNSDRICVLRANVRRTFSLVYSSQYFVAIIMEGSRPVCVSHRARSQNQVSRVFLDCDTVIDTMTGLVHDQSACESTVLDPCGLAE